MWSKIFTVTVSLLGIFSVAQAQTLPPSDVENLSAEAGNREIVLTWDAAEDDGFVSGYRVYYGTNPVIEADDSYEDDLYTNSAEATYVVQNLLNGVEYYFSVTAIDDDQMESINYSNEASAVPVAPVGEDMEGPKMISAVHTAPNEVTVVMSEPIAPTDPSSFLLSNESSFEEVVIQDIVFNSENLIMKLPLNALVPGENYELIATSAVEDLAGNPVSSGITDTVVFTAEVDFPEPEPVVQPEPEPEPEPEPVIEEPPLLTEDEPLDLDPVVDLIDDNFDEFDDLFSELEDVPSDNLTEEEPDKPSAPDLTAPLEAQGLKADTSEVESSNQVTLSWEPALDLDNDIVDQVLYLRTGLGSWDDGYSLGKSVDETTIDVQPNQNYQVRIVTIDVAGNESEGASFSFSTNLSQTGPGTVIALSVALLIGMMMLLSSRRRA